MRANYTVNMLTFLLLTFMSVSFSNASEIEKAVVEQDWETVHQISLEQVELSQKVKEFLYSVACLELELDCAPKYYTHTTPDAIQLDEAETWVYSLESRYPNNSSLQFLIGTIYAWSGDHQRAFKSLTTAIKLDSSNAAAFSQRGILFLSIGQYESAIEDFGYSIKYRSESAQALVNRGAAYDEAGLYKKALIDYTAALLINPSLAHIYYNRGNTFKHMGKVDDAISDFTQAILSDPSYAAAYYNRAGIYLDLGNIPMAIIDYQACLNTATKEMEPLIPLAKSQIEQLKNIGNLEPSSELERIVEAGIRRFEQGDYDSATQLLNRALSMDSTYSEAYYYRAAVALQTGNSESALHDFNKTIHYNPFDTTAYFNRGQIFREFERNVEALSDFSSAIALNKEYTKAYFARAETYELLYKLDSAILDYERYLTFDLEMSKTHRQDVISLVNFLRTGGKVIGLEDAKEVVKDAMKAWRKKDWLDFATHIHSDDLMQFKSMCSVWSKRITGDNEVIILSGKIYSLNDPRQYFTMVIQGMSGDNGPFDKFLFISSAKLTELVPRGQDRILAHITIKAGNGKSAQKAEMELNIRRVDKKWSIELPHNFMFVAEELNKMYN